PSRGGSPRGLRDVAPPGAGPPGGPWYEPEPHRAGGGGTAGARPADGIPGRAARDGIGGPADALSCSDTGRARRLRHGSRARAESQESLMTRVDLSMRRTSFIVLLVCSAACAHDDRRTANVQAPESRTSPARAPASPPQYLVADPGPRVPATV